MKKLSKKGVLLLAMVVAMGAYAMPSAASAATWGPAGTTHVLDAPSLEMSVPAIGFGWRCAASLHLDVRSPASSSATSTSATFSGCVGTGLATVCAITSLAVGLPWTATGATTTNVTLDGVHINTMVSGAMCALGNPVPVTASGNLAGGVWNAVSHTVAFTSATGLSGSVGGTPIGPLAVNGTFTDTPFSLTLS